MDRSFGNNLYFRSKIELLTLFFISLENSIKEWTFRNVSRKSHWLQNNNNSNNHRVGCAPTLWETLICPLLSDCTTWVFLNQHLKNVTLCSMSPASKQRTKEVGWEERKKSVHSSFSICCYLPTFFWDPVASSRARIGTQFCHTAKFRYFPLYHIASHNVVIMLILLNDSIICPGVKNSI